MTWAERNLNLTIKTVSRTKDTSGFIVLPRRWVVGRSLAWTMNARRHARDYERLVQHSETLITWAAITLITKRLTRTGPTAWPKKPQFTADVPPQFTPAEATEHTAASATSHSISDAVTQPA